MNNPELRAVLTEALSEALKRLWTDPEDAVDQADWDALPGKLADVIASLPGVAVIQLPEPDVDEYGNTTFADGTVVTFKDGWTQLRLEDIGRDDCYDWDDDQLRDFGAALLAAAAVVATGEEA
ncbi:hypothetical protein SEA_LUNABLU_82 [Mycobacterium Phage LunaBlu]|nr:hypothetical protein SEA_LUNABLU_82 [Mycobacterium Phage LunaBlu]